MIVELSRDHWANADSLEVYSEDGNGLNGRSNKTGGLYGSGKRVSPVVFEGKQGEAEQLKEIVVEPKKTISWPRSETG